MDNNVIINEKYLKKYSPIPLNFNIDEVSNFVSISETIWIRPVLGTALYDEILDQVKNNNLSPENSTLLVEAVWPYEGFAVAYEALPFIWSHISEVGVTLGKSDNSDSATLKDITYVQSHLRKQVEARKDFLVKYLYEHQSTFPLWVYDECSCGCSLPEGSCCNADGKLYNPNKMRFIYTPKKFDAGLR